jgi:putative flippase GtrA
MKLSSILKRPAYRYVVVGVSVYVLEIVVIVVAGWLGASAILAVALSFWIGLMVSFCLQKIMTFGDKRMHHKVLIPQILAFSVLVLFNFGFTLLVTKLLAQFVSPIIIRTLALGCTTIWNFYLYRTRIFKFSDDVIY